VAAIIRDAALEGELLMTNAAATNLGQAAGDGMEAVADAQINSQDPLPQRTALARNATDL
jgi:hypothetical protein